MPIHLNLLAEAQAAEELRRRDPVKRATVSGSLLVALVLVWSVSLQMKALLANSELSGVERKMSARTNEYQRVLDNRKKLTEINQNLAALRQLTTNRFLNGSLLNALQQINTEQVQLTHLRVEQNYVRADATKASTNGTRLVPGKPATVSEKIVLTLEAKDSSPTSDQYNKFKEAVASHPYFQNALGKTNEVRLTNLSLPQSSGDGRAFVLFTLECRLPEVTR